jgi:hypothetical protein
MTVPAFEPMTDAEFQSASAILPQPIACLRCGRPLFSRASILRGYGMTCAWHQALEELSYPGRNPKRPPVIHAATFERINQNRFEIVGRNDTVVGHLTLRGSQWWIELWDTAIDFDLDLGNAKRRALRILERMGRA